MKKEVYEYWNLRAKGEFPGSNDFNVKKLELQAIMKHLKKYKFNSLLDVGCGGGDTIHFLNGNFDKKVKKYTGVDISENMIDTAKSKKSKNTTFFVSSLPELTNVRDRFDVIISERSIINLENDKEQCDAVGRISELLNDGGVYIMIESFLSGLNNLNSLREELGLSKISSPWHNHYISDETLKFINDSTSLHLEVEDNFASTYYLLSRGIYARLSEDKNEKPVYDSDINLLSIRFNLPKIGDYSPTKIIIWKKEG